MVWHRFGAVDPFDQVIVFLGHDHFERVERLVIHVGEILLGELAENEIHLADAAVPAAKQDPPAAGVEIGARTFQTGHFKNLLC